MALTRQSITRGSGILYWGSGTPLAIPSSTGIDAGIDIKEIEVAADHKGTIDRRLTDIEAKIGLTPLGRATSELLAVLYPNAFQNPSIGASIFGATDTPCIVHSAAGKKLTFCSAAVTKMPPLILSASKVMYGAMEITAIRRNGAEWSETDALYELANEAFVEPAVASSDILMGKYAASWGDVLDEIETQDGWTIEPAVQVQADAIDGYGTNDYLLQGVTCMARCRPKNLSETLIDKLQVQGAGVAIGMSRRRGKNLYISGNGLDVRLYDAVLQKGPLVWKNFEVRTGEIAFMASRIESEGEYGAIFGVALA